MGLSTKLLPRLQKSLSMTFSLQKALDLLAMPEEGVVQYVEEVLETNPLLESTRVRGGEPLGEVVAKESFADRILAQVREAFLDKKEEALALRIFEGMDERGFWEEENLEGYSEDEVEKVVAVLQTFDPPGIFARDLRESFLLQLQRRGENGVAYRIVEEHFSDFLRGRYRKIEQQLGEIAWERVIALLRTLSFRPRGDVDRESAPSGVVDLRFAFEGGKWRISSGSSIEVELASSYRDVQGIAVGEKEVLTLWRQEANGLLRALSRRKKILLQVAKGILQLQKNYLLGEGPLERVTLVSLAKIVHLHISTISRAISGKWVDTPKGRMPLSSLLSAAPSTQAIQELLALWIREEDGKHPWTDEELSSLFRQKGIALARRTIAKYRKELGIPSYPNRKKSASS